jgi:LPXTG-motif cell wall-anchored protein
MKKVITLLVLALTLGPVGVASAQSVEDTYRGESTVIGELNDPRSQPPAKSTVVSQEPSSSTSVPPIPVETTGRSMPDTGAEVAVIVLAGLALVAAGFGLRRVARQAGA